MKTTCTLLAEFLAIICIISEFNFYEKTKALFIDSILGKNLHTEGIEFSWTKTETLFT